jgi:tetratricopeptide (TPR) repeat protein
VVHLPLNVNEGEGELLSESNKVGTTYPVFILANSSGQTIRRWIGYTGGAQVLVNTLNNALTDLTTVEERLERFKTKATFEDALFIAGYYSGIRENLKAVEYYRKSLELGKGSGFDYSYKIFENIANAVWKDELEFDEVIPAADAVLNAEKKDTKNIVDVARLMTRLAVKADQIDKLKKYLKAGIDNSAISKNKQIQAANIDLQADYTLYIEKDVQKAIGIKKRTMALGWQDNRDAYYMFAKWCLIRKINLDEAEMYARKTLPEVQPGKYRARVYTTLAEILEANNKIDGALEARKNAVAHDPENDYYQEELERLESE